MQEFPPTPEQQLIFSAAQHTKKNLMIKAYAGCGKTSTLVGLAKHLDSSRPALALAFNFKIKEEMEKRLPSNFTVKTMNGLGHAAFSKMIGKRLILDDKKIGKLVTALFKEVRWEGKDSDWMYVKECVSWAMTMGLVPSNFGAKGLVEDSPSSWAAIGEAKFGFVEPKLLSFARNILAQSIVEALAGNICFDDQIYMSALFGGIFPSFSQVLCDETQDFSLLNIIQLRKVVTTGNSRLFVVGDPFQSIYQWRGADSRSMEKIRALRPEWEDLSLSLTFRCPKIVVERQQKHVPGFTAHESNYSGHYLRLRRPSEQEEGPFWTWKQVLDLRRSHSASSVSVLCRNNSPLFNMAFALLASGVGCTMLGRDIGKSLGALVKKIIPDPQASVKDCALLVLEWENREVTLAKVNGNDNKMEAAQDKAACIQAILTHGLHIQTRQDLLTAIDSLFADKKEVVQLSTIHKAKGLEWDLVLHLDPWRLPGKRVEPGSEEYQQELNLIYVAETRAKRVLLEANMDDFKRGL